MSKSGWVQREDAQKADHALSQGIALTDVKSRVGIHSPPCATDVHDAVVVMGALEEDVGIHGSASPELEAQKADHAATSTPEDSAIRRRAWASAPEATATHYTTPPPRLRRDVKEYIEMLTQNALSDSGHLSDIQVAAQKLLATFYLDGNAIRTDEQVVEAMATPIYRREMYVAALATRHGVAQPAAAGCGYTKQQWIEWYSQGPLSEDEMDEAVRLWKEEFPINEETRNKIDGWT